MFQEITDDFEFEIRIDLIEKISFGIDSDRENIFTITDYFNSKEHKIFYLNRMDSPDKANAYVINLAEYGNNINLTKEEARQLKEILDTKAAAYDINYVFSDLTKVRKFSGTSVNHDWKIIIY